MSQVYEYRVRDQRGKILKGIIEAENKQLVVGKLREQGYYVTDIKEKVQSKDVSEVFSAWFGTSLKDLVVFSRQFSTMISAGLPILKSLDILVQQTKQQHFKEAILDLKREVESGSTLSGAMIKHPKVFPKLFVTMIHAGEVGGVLDMTLNRLAEHYEKEHELREKIKTATRYPVVVLCFAIIIIIIMLFAVIPKFAKMFADMHLELPLPTKILMGISTLFTSYVHIAVLALSIIIYGLYKYLQTNEGKELLDRIVSNLPVFGELKTKINVARISRTLATLMYSGVPIMQALDVVKSLASDLRMRQGLESALESIRLGEGMAQPLEQTGAFPLMVTQMIAVGEETGNIDAMLNKVADYYEKEVANTTDRLTSLLEPFLIVFLALVVGGIILSIILPVFNLSGHILQR